MKTLLKIENLYIEADGKKILQGVDLVINRGEIQALLGPNASGKSTLTYALAGLPKYKIKKGKIFFEGKEITGLSPEKRSKLGIAISWQSPPDIKGVKLSQLLKEISGMKFEDLKFSFDSKLLDRDVNVGFSGGERKVSELLQILSLKPKLIIFDEIDSGLDIKKLEETAKIIKKELADKRASILVITHSGTILQFLKPKFVNIMVNGKIICRTKDYKKVLKTIQKYSYEKCKKCKFLAN